MKNLIYLVFIGILITACSDNDSVPPAVENKVPAIPVLKFPADGEICVESTLTFQWDIAVDPDNDDVIYQVQIALDAGFLNVVETIESIITNQTIVLEKNSRYYWRVKSTDSKGLSSAYTVYRSFYTAPDAKINHLPFAPQLVQPSRDFISNTNRVTLEWNAVDPDADDTLVYDVYFATANATLEKISENTVLTRLEINVEPEKEYFWQVVVKDNHNGQTEGQVWNFKVN